MGYSRSQTGDPDHTEEIKMLFGERKPESKTAKSISPQLLLQASALSSSAGFPHNDL